MISELDRRITIKTYVFGQTESGGVIKALSNSYSVWANVKQKSGSRSLDNNQISYQEVYEIKTRHEASRLKNLTDEIVYEGSILSIHEIKEDSEGKKKYNLIEAYSTGSNISSSTDINTVVDMVHYEATGGEFSLQDNKLKGKTLLLVFRDGVEYYPITTGTASNKKTLYNAVAGTLEFDNNLLPLRTGEVVDVYILK